MALPHDTEMQDYTGLGREEMEEMQADPNAAVGEEAGAPSSEGEGDEVGAEDDSSEEEEDNEEDLRKIQQGFIVDEADEEESDAEKQKRRKHKRHRKHRHKQREQEDEEISEEDRELIEENMGIRRGLTRIRRGRVDDSESPEPAASRRPGQLSDEGDDLRRIFDDDRGGDDMEVDDEDDFIDDDGEDGEVDEDERRERRRTQKERRKVFGGRPDMAGLDPGVWDEIYDVFGNGSDYDWALDGEDAAEHGVEESLKPEMKYTDVFEPSEIKARHLTEDDDIIRMADIPERMQLSASTLSPSATLTLHEAINFTSVVGDASAWVATRISSRVTRDFFRTNSTYRDLLPALILAISRALELLLVKNYEVPYIHTHWRDLVSHFDPDKKVLTQLLSRDELWKVGILGMKYRALMERKQSLLKSYEKMKVVDEYFDDDIKDKLDTIEAVADAAEWLGMKYRQAQKDAMELPDDESQDMKKIKKPTRYSAYELARQTVTSKLADAFGLSSQEVIRNFLNRRKMNDPIDQSTAPLAYAGEFVSDAIPGRDATRQLEVARMILATEIGKDPLMRKEIRNVFEKEAVVSVTPTDKGNEKIDEFHPYHNFKFLKDKPVTKMIESQQFLQILQAESEGLVSINIHLPDVVVQKFEEQLYNAFASEAVGTVGRAWNAERKEIVKEATEKHLLSVGAKWAREWLREEVEDHLAKKCGDVLQDRINQAPYKTEEIAPGDVPSVLAISWGKGDPQKDAIHCVILDEEGRLRDHLKVDNLFDVDLREQFVDLVKRRNPDVIVVGGFSVATKKLMDQVKNIINPTPEADKQLDGAPLNAGSAGPSSQQNGGWGSQPAAGDWGASNNSWGATNGNSDWGVDSGGLGDASSGPGWTAGTDPARQTSASPDRPKSKDKQKEKEKRTPILYVNDEVARIYQHSRRAEDEYGRIPVVGRYCVGLARYVQSPLNEYAALGSDLIAITFDEAQGLVPKEKLFSAFERALVNIVNMVGVDINRAVIDPYYQSLLPFVAGLGPRKAAQLIQKISAMGGTLVNRSQLIHENLVPLTIFLNCSGFLRISRDMSYRKSSSKKRNRKDASDALPDPLDDTRIHPEDYDLAKKMALDALEMDDDDVDDDAHAAQQIARLMDDAERAQKLNVLRLDDFATILLKEQEKSKRHSLNMIKEELLSPFGEQRKEFELPDEWEIITMLTGETQTSLRRGTIVSVSILRIKQQFVAVRMDSGIEGVISAQYVANEQGVSPDSVMQKGQTLPVIIIAVYPADLRVEFSARPMDVANGDANVRRVPTDEFYDKAAELRNKDLLDRKKRQDVDQVRRIIKHPNFHNLNYKKAEEILAHQQRGDVVIRPSTKGPDHLAVTWKVEEGVYQHIDVVDVNADVTSQNVGSQLVVDKKYTFSDLDELIVNHVKAMARRVEELMAHDKFQKGSESEIHVFLDNAVKAQRGSARSVYAFGLNRSRPGYFNLYFKTNMNSPIQSWPVKVTPNGFQLFETEVGSVPDLCDSFKTRVMQGNSNGAAGAQTPYTAGRTPAITPGRATPGHVSSRQTPGHASTRFNPNSTNKTPNPYGGAAKTPNPYQPPGGSRPPVPVAGANSGGSSQWGASTSDWGGGSSWGGGANSGWATPATGSKQPPPGGPPAGAPAGMHPARAAMIQGNNSSSSSGWGQSSGNRW